MKNTIKVIMASLLLFMLTSCSQLIPTVDHHPVGGDESEAETVSDPILSIRFWVPYGGVPRELVEMHDWGGHVAGVYDNIFYEEELQANETIVVRPRYASVDELLTYNSIAKPHRILMTCEYDGSIKATVKAEQGNDYAGCLFPFKAEGLHLIEPSMYSSSGHTNVICRNEWSQTHCLQTSIQIICDYDSSFIDMSNPYCREFCSYESLKDIVNTSIPEAYEIERLKYEVTVIITAMDFKTQQINARAEVKITWHSSWDYWPALEHITKDETSPYYKKPNGAVHYLYDNIGLENCPYYTIEMVDYWQVVEEE